jgi:hypothetical protein
VDAEDGQQEHRDIRASDADRNDVVQLLTDAATDGRLTLEEYTERSGTAYAARTVGELADLTADLTRTSTAIAPRASGVIDTGPEEMIAIFGNESRKGRWMVPEHLQAKSIFGDCHIEMQNAILQHRVTTIDATARFGSVTIFVPDGVDVRLTGRAIFGDKSSKLRGEPRPGAPVLVVRCDVFCGSVTVRAPKWSMR